MTSSLNFLERLNRTKFRGVSLAQQKIFGEYNVWHFYQAALFSDIQALRDSYSLPKENKTSLSIEIKDALLETLSIFVSLFASAKLFLGLSRIIVFSIDKTNSRVLKNDARLDPLYTALKKTNARFTEVFHSYPSRALVGNLLARKRVAVYDCALDTLYSLWHPLTHTTVDVSLLDLSLFSESEKPLVMYLVGKYLSRVPRSIFKIKLLSFLLKHSKVRAIFSIDTPRDYSELVLAAKMASVPVYAFQHGHFTKYHVGWLTTPEFAGTIVHPDRLYVWSEYWKKELLALGTYFLPEEIIVGGSKSILDSLPMHEREGAAVLIPFETDANKKEVRSYIDSGLNAGFNVIFKTRSDRNEEEQLDAYGLTRHYHPKLLATSDTKKALKESDIVAGAYSTFLYDAVEAGRPVIYLKTSSDFGEGIWRNGLAAIANGPGDFSRAVEEAMSLPVTELSARREKLIGKSTQNLSDTIEKLLANI